MKQYVIKVSTTILVVLLFGLTFNSCKKTGNSIDTNEAQNEKARVIAATIKRYGNITAPIIVQINQPASSVSYTDRHGVIINLGRSNRTQATCGTYDCSTAPSPSDLYTYYYLTYIKWFYKCGGGNNLTATWDISVPYTPLLQDPNSSAYSYGNIRIVHTGSVLVTSGNLGNGNLEIVNNGTDPNCSSNTLYRITYTWQNVSDTYFPGNGVESSLTLYNNCSASNYNIALGFSGGPPSSTSPSDVFSHPCYRVDEAFVNPATPYITYTSIAGAYVLCYPPGGYTGTTYQQVEYRAIDNGSSNLWGDQTSSIHGGVYSGTTSEVQQMSAYADVLDLLHMTYGSGSWLVRYRNRYTGCTSLGRVGGDWGEMWVTEVWNV